MSNNLVLKNAIKNGDVISFYSYINQDQQPSIQKKNAKAALLELLEMEGGGFSVMETKEIITAIQRRTLNDPEDSYDLDNMFLTHAKLAIKKNRPELASMILGHIANQHAQKFLTGDVLLFAAENATPATLRYMYKKTRLMEGDGKLSERRRDALLVVLSAKPELWSLFLECEPQLLKDPRIAAAHKESLDSDVVVINNTLKSLTELGYYNDLVTNNLRVVGRASSQYQREKEKKHDDEEEEEEKRRRLDRMNLELDEEEKRVRERSTFLVRQRREEEEQRQKIEKQRQDLMTRQRQQEQDEFVNTILNQNQELKQINQTLHDMMGEIAKRQKQIQETKRQEREVLKQKNAELRRQLVAKQRRELLKFDDDCSKQLSDTIQDEQRIIDEVRKQVGYSDLYERKQKFIDTVRKQAIDKFDSILYI